MKPFKIKNIPSIKELNITNNMYNLMNEIYYLLGKLSMYDKNEFMKFLTLKEAICSTQIEGTQVSLMDVLNPNNNSAKNLDVLDVTNYTKALKYGTELLKIYPLCGNFLKKIHKVLLSDTRGNDKNPGEFRKSQNWIGANGCNLNEARYVPPTVEEMNKAISDLEKYINDSTDNPLIKASLAHYQFETIHPFLDGNGRIGRMLIVLILLNEKVLNMPILYISYYLKKHRTEYYDRLEEVRLSGNYEQWITFMLRAFKNSSLNCIETINEILKLKAELDNKIKDESNNFKAVYNYIYEYPIVDISNTSKQLNISYNTVSTIINKLVNYNILEKTDDNKRNKVYYFNRYIDILKKDTENIEL